MNDLFKRTILGSVQLMIGLAVMLFVPAGGFNYWQAWVYLFIFSASIFFILFYLYKNDPILLQRRLKRVEKEKTQQWIQFYIFILYIGLFVLCSIDHRFSWSNVPRNVVFLGDILVTFGYFLIFLVLKENTFAAATVELAADQKVISSGPYAIVRHPMYLGAIILLLGTPLALGSWWGLLVFILMTFMIAFRLLDEEIFLSRDLLGYKEYCQKTKYRLMPFLW